MPTSASPNKTNDNRLQTVVNHPFNKIAALRYNLINANFLSKKTSPPHVVLVPQDTTELDFSRPEQQVVGAGPLDGSSRRGAFLHTNQAFTPDGLALGILSAKIWARDEPDPNTPPLSQSEKQKKSRGTPFEQRESFRWFEGMQAVQQAAEQCPETQFISLNDSEGDMFELLRFQRRSSNFQRKERS